MDWGVYDCDDKLIFELKTELKKLEYSRKILKENKILKNIVLKQSKQLESKKNLIQQSPIKPEIKIKVFELRESGLSYRGIAKKLKISKSSVGNIINNK